MKRSLRRFTAKRGFACASWAGGGASAPPPEQFQNEIAPGCCPPTGTEFEELPHLSEKISASVLCVLFDVAVWSQQFNLDIPQKMSIIGKYFFIKFYFLLFFCLIFR
ncbi:MAG: hypothetical protein LBN96_00890 [Desulfovibrio sp.]|nr:hypothetical protein [Desulfovibrio sp.]